MFKAFMRSLQHSWEALFCRAAGKGNQRHQRPSAKPFVFTNYKSLRHSPDTFSTATACEFKKPIKTDGFGCFFLIFRYLCRTGAHLLPSVKALDFARGEASCSKHLCEVCSTCSSCALLGSPCSSSWAAAGKLPLLLGRCWEAPAPPPEALLGISHSSPRTVFLVSGREKRLLSIKTRNAKDP